MILKPITTIHLEGTLRSNQDTALTNGIIQFRAGTIGTLTQAFTDGTGHYTADLLAGQYQITAIFRTANGRLQSEVTANGLTEFDHSQTYDIVIPTSTLTVSVRNPDGTPVTDAPIQFETTRFDLPDYRGATFVSNGYPRLDTNGNLTLPMITGSTLNNPVVMLPSGLVIPFTAPIMNVNRRLYLILDQTTGQLFVDETPPVVTGHPDRVANANGWYRAPVTVTWSSVDPLPSSGAASTPSPTVVSAEGADQLVTSAESCDPAGNCASGHLSLSIDATRPAITYEISPAANADRWHKDAVTVTFTCADTLSGIASCPAPVVVDADGADQTITGTATDKAGNTTSATATISLDQVAPVITATLSQAANGGGWNNGDVTVTFTCSDALSGIKTCSAQVTLTEDGANQTVTGSATDKAGNSSGVSVSVSIDKAKPLITAVRTPANAYGWNNTPVTVTFSCTDTLSHIVTCPSPVTVSGEGAHQSVSGTAVNGAGTSATAVVDDINIDKSAPTIAATVSGTKNAAGWYRIAPTISYTCQDTLSGIAICPADRDVTTDGANQSVTATATDKAGNTADVTVTGLNIDRTSPVVHVLGAANGATYTLDQLPSISCTTADPTSGVAAQATATVTRSATGTYTATCAGGRDVAGNIAAPVSITYTVTPTATSLGALTDQYVTGSGQPNANGVSHDLDNKLLHGQICQYINKVGQEATGPHPTLTAAQAAELIYWARTMDPTC